MFALFCIRLAFGLMICLTLLPRDVNPRFFRTHFLTVLGFLAGAAIFTLGQGSAWLWVILGLAIAVAFVASIVWHIEGNPGGHGFIYVEIVLLGTLLVLMAIRGEGAAASGDMPPPHAQLMPFSGWLLVDNFSAAAVLGTALTAMLMGHFYLIAPTMSLTPLFRLISAFALAVIVRMLCAALGLWLWARSNSGGLETEFALWLAVRWIVGIIGPLALGWMALETARIRSTQSATGILYVVVILVFLGELTSQLLSAKTGALL